ncbi:hypothetical protein IWX78_001006 [Mycetocola sp. CAN_C7]|uniref:DUF6194 family protein n=1 Tax=Mycetocola sp. CAN_C7 TaxID=2787724 RepID=UPI0018CA249E
MSESDLLTFAAVLPGVTVVTADEAFGAPESAWGDSFVYYDPNDDAADRMMPFATIVASDYPGFDEASDLHRPGIYRLNVAVGRARFAELIGYLPDENAAHASDVDYSELDRLIPHPVYASQGWVSVLNPGERTLTQARDLITEAWALAARRHTRRSRA